MSVEKMKEYYDKGLWSKSMVDRLHALGKIDDEGYAYILGEEVK